MDLNGVRFNFEGYKKRTDKYGFTREFHRYRAESLDENQNRIAAAFTPKGYVRYIDVNPELEYHKVQTKTRLSEEPGASIYAQRKIDVESVFGYLKAYLHFTRFTVRGNDKVKRQMGFVLMAVNMGKLAGQLAPYSSASIQLKKDPDGNLPDFHPDPLF